ncbi:uncharacterized transporter slc-17.2-like isoform X1 [Spodoptera litura]|uniref:Uncharacterized transporter slc-17.2-like isoform X1 n=1 Tax=Spodoptera litura TaxID=69820 RepID=A0A9J7E732_SPOLT|nr:uncharacterized transporter slc-17.2-like isoform X1 [Spodoptera litura]
MAEPTTVDKGSGIPVRFIVAIMMFFACGINYMMRVNVSVNIIAMVPRDITNKKQQSECESTQTNKSELMQPPGTPTFNWTNQEQAYVLGGYFWGYATSCVVGGTVAEQYGPRKVVFYTMIIAAILTGLTPPAAMISVQMLLASRVVGGLAAGFLFPSLHALLAHWAPPQEKSKFVSALLGGAIGTACTWSLSGPLIKALGWPYAFYIQGLIGITWCFVWLYLVHDSPRTHPRISKGEREYILNAIGDKIAHGQKVKTPFKKILTSFPYLAMVVLHYGNDWGIYFIMTAAPKFISGALGFDLSSVGGLSSLPYICRMCFALGFGYIGDRIIQKQLMRTIYVRKFFTIFSHIIPGLLLFALGYAGCRPMLSVGLISFSLGLNGAACLTNLVNHQDLAPNFAGTLYGLANGVGNTAGFITPLVTAYFTRDGNGFAQWRLVFLVGSLLYILTAVWFIIFGTSETQPWNYPENNEPGGQRKK